MSEMDGNSEDDDSNQGTDSSAVSESESDSDSDYVPSQKKRRQSATLSVLKDSSSASSPPVSGKGIRRYLVIKDEVVEGDGDNPLLFFEEQEEQVEDVGHKPPQRVSVSVPPTIVRTYRLVAISPQAACTL
jgi:hypothetical protein